MSSSATATRARKSGQPQRNTLVGQNRAIPYSFITPAVVLVSLALAFPVLYGVYRSLFRIRIDPEAPFIGLGNYTALFTQSSFWTALGRSLVFIGGCILVGQVLGVIFALALNQATKGLRFLRGLSIVPYIVSSIGAAVLFRMLFNSEFGLPNQVAGIFGGQSQSWLSDPSRAMFAVIIAQVWTDLPLSLLVMLGGLQTIDPSHLDAASVDGATGWQRVRHITLPLISPQFALSMVFLSYHALTSLGVILGLTGGGPGTATETLAISMYRTAFRALNQGQALAIMIIILLMNGALTLVYLRLSRSQDVS